MATSARAEKVTCGWRFALAAIALMEVWLPILYANSTVAKTRYVEHRRRIAFSIVVIQNGFFAGARSYDALGARSMSMKARRAAEGCLRP